MNKKSPLIYILSIFYSSFLELTKKKKLQFFVGSAILLLGCSLNIFIQLFFKSIISTLSKAPFSLSHIIFMSLIIGYGIFWTINQMSSIIALFILYPVLTKISQTIITKSFLHMLQIPYSYFLKKESKIFGSYFDTIFHATSNILSNMIIHIVPSIIEMLVTFVLFFYLYSLLYSSLLLILFIIFFYFSYKSILYSRSLDSYYYKYLDLFHANINQVTTNIQIIKTYDAYSLEEKNMASILEHFFAIAKQRSIGLNKFQIHQITASGIILFIITIIGAYSVQSSFIELGDFVLINNYFIQFTVPITFLGYVFSDVYKNILLLKKSLTIFDLDKENNIDLLPFKDPFTPSITLKNITLEIQGKKILSNVSLDIKKHEKIAIVGSSGSGKSSLLKTITKLLPISEGNILISDEEIKEIKNNEIYQKVTFIPQNSYIFYGTIESNIRYNTPNISDQEIISILKKVNLYEKIKKFENGIYTQIDNIDFSGGEKQRLAIARGLIRKSEIFLFDEITASLDSKIEQEIHNYLKNFLEEKTAIFVTHKPIFAKDADRIIVLKKGKIEAIGTHKKLLKDSSEYQQIAS